MLRDMTSLVAWHSMLVELHGGMLALTAFCIFAILLSRAHFNSRKTSETYGLFWVADSYVGKLAQFAEPTAYLASIGSVIGLIAAAIVGFYVYPLSFITSSPLGLSHVFLAILATDLMIVFVFLRSRYGQGLWNNRGTAAVYAGVGFLGFLCMVLSGSLGGHLAGTGSVLDQVYAFVGINPNNFGINSSNFLGLSVGLTVIALAVPTVIFMRFDRKAIKNR